MLRVPIRVVISAMLVHCLRPSIKVCSTDGSISRILSHDILLEAHIRLILTLVVSILTIVVTIARCVLLPVLVSKSNTTVNPVRRPFTLRLTLWLGRNHHVYGLLDVLHLSHFHILLFIFHCELLLL